eukprot:c49412_g1_i1 orf=348-545(+)
MWRQLTFAHEELQGKFCKQNMMAARVERRKLKANRGGMAQSTRASMSKNLQHVASTHLRRNLQAK